MDHLRMRRLAERQWNPFWQVGRANNGGDADEARSVAAAAAVDAAAAAAAADAAAVAVLDACLSA